MILPPVKKFISLIVILLLLNSTVVYGDDQSDVASKVNPMRGSTDYGTFGEIFTTLFNSTGHIKDGFINVFQNSTQGYVPFFDGGELNDSGIYQNSGNGNIGIGTTLTTTDKVNVLGTLNATGLSENGTTISSIYQKLITNSTCDYGISNIAGDGTVTCALNNDTDTNTQLSQEQVQDYIGSMVSGNTETNITVTYNDSTNKLDFVIGTVTENDPQVGINTTNYLSKWNGSSLVSSDLFNNSGRIGIGTTNPGAKFEIWQTGTSNSDGFRIDGSGLDSWRFYLDENKVANIERASQKGNGISITHDGKVGIGTTSPNSKLDIRGRTSIGDGTNTVTIGQWDGVNNRIESVGRKLFLTSYNGGIGLGNSGSENLTINSSGNVGIGTTTPTEKLDVNGNAVIRGNLDLTGGTLSGDDITDGTIDSTELAPQSVYSSEIADNTITEADISDSFKARDSSKLDGLISTSYLKDDGWNTTPGQNANTQNDMSVDFTYSNNAPHTGPLMRVGASNYSLQLNAEYNGNGDNLSFRTYNNDGAKAWNPWFEIFHSGNDGAGSGLDSDKLDNLDSTQFLRSDANDTLTGRVEIDKPSDYDQSSVTSLTNAPIYVPEVNVGSTSTFLPFLHQRALHSGGYRTHMNLGLYKGNNGWDYGKTGFYIALGGNDNNPTKYFTMTAGGDIKHSDGQVFFHSGNDGSGSGIDADRLDNIDSGSFLRADVDDNIFEKITVGSTNNRRAGMYGIYDSNKVGHIWSMGTAYQIPENGSNFGNLYGLAYKHTNNTSGGNMAGGHQMVWVQNGVGRAAMGDNIWTSGAYLSDGTTVIDSNAYIVGDRIQQNTVDSSEIQDNSITASDLAANSVGDSEMIDEPRFKSLRFTGEGGNSGNSYIGYGIYQEGGNWTNPYPDLVIGYHTGIKIGGHKNYNGTRFYNDSPGAGSASVVMEVANGDDGVKINNSLGIGVEPRTDGYKLAMGGPVYMGNQDVNYVNQLHFNDNLRFHEEGNDNYLNFRYGDPGSGGIKFVDGNSKLQGYIYTSGNENEFGLLDSDGQWAIRSVRDNYVELRDNNEVTFRAGQGGVSGNYGTVQTHGNGKGGWEGYSINGRYNFMSPDDSQVGIYNDVDNEWMTHGTRNGTYKLFYNGAEKIRTESDGITVTGKIKGVSNPTSAQDVATKDYVDIKSAESGGVPIGTIASFNSTSCPAGWIIADGTNGTPDLRGEFVRGLDSGRGVDSGRNVGSAQGDAIRNITGTIKMSNPNQGASGVFRAYSTPGTDTNSWHGGNSNSVDFDVSTVVPTANENRPRNVALLYCMKNTGGVSGNLEGSMVEGQYCRYQNGKINCNNDILTPTPTFDQVIINNPPTDNNHVATKDYVDNNVSATPTDVKFLTKTYKIKGIGTSSVYNCLKVILPEQCVNTSKNDVGPACEVITNDRYDGWDSTGGSSYTSGGYSRFFRVMPEGPDSNHVSGKRRIMRGYTSNGADWYTYTTTHVVDSNRNTGLSASGILGRDKWQVCTQFTTDDNSDPNKDPKEVMLISRGDYTTVFTIKYPVSKDESSFDQVYPLDLDNENNVAHSGTIPRRTGVERTINISNGPQLINLTGTYKQISAAGERSHQFDVYIKTAINDPREKVYAGPHVRQQNGSYNATKYIHSPNSTTLYIRYYAGVERSSNEYFDGNVQINY